MTNGLIARMRSIWRGVRHRGDIEAEMEEEFRLHTELRARDLERAGLTPGKAVRVARQEFGSTARYKEESRASRGLHRIDQIRFSWLDFKLGFRMLARYPGLTLVGCLAIAVAIALGSLYFEAINKWQNPRLPVADGARVVSIRNWDRSALAPEGRSLHDLAIWRSQVKTVNDLGAAIVFMRNLATEDRRIEPVRGAEMSASAFRLMRVRPLLGRVLTEQDERPGESPVVVISHNLWQARFASDPRVVGRTVKLGTTSATIVGVMPEGFGFPTNQRIWAPLRVDGATLAPRTGPGVQIFGRLAPRVSLKDVQAEFAAIGGRVAADYPETHENLRPRVTTYAKPMLGGEALIVRNIMYVVNGMFIMLLVVVCANVATLVFARTATRGWEITVRNALGASRARIIAQLFVEALVLAGVAAVLGLVVAKFSLAWGLNLFAGSDSLPFWVDDNLSLATVLYTALLTLIGASIVGVLPALRITKVNVQDALRSESAARSGLRFGGIWTAVIVVQVALTVGLMPLAAGGVFESNRFRQRAEGIGADRYLTASIGIDREDYTADSAAFAARTRGSYDALERRLAAEPGVEQVTFADRLPVMDQFKYNIEVDTMSGGPVTGVRTSTAVHVARGFFATFGTSVIAGRDFTPVDYETGRVLIVNQSFARHVLGGRSPVGQRIRIRSGDDGEGFASDDWYEIVGVVKDFGWQLPLPHEQSAIYHPRLPTAGARVSLAVRVRDPEAFGPRLRTIAAQVDPTIRLLEVQPLTGVGGSEARINWALTSVAWLVSFIVLLLSATGIHSLMAFTVARRTREIGIRTALGAHPRRLVAGIFSRAFMQIGIGVLAGSGLAALWGLDSTRQIVLLLAANGVMLLVGLSACAVPLRRALRIDPTEALRAEA
ncbi:MAG TPA: ABC transporter permease [Longimicrobiales bacterium]|nr:ABC transporter permease [Longimicrobiales bacterium]